MKQVFARGVAAMILGGATALASAQDGSESLCTGLTVLTDAAGDASFQGIVPVPEDTYDLLSVTVAQPASPDGVNRFVFTLKTAGLPGPIPPVASWYTSFKAPNNAFYGVRMNTDPQGAVAFETYSVAASLDADGSGGASDGRFADAPAPAEPESSFSADGTITVVVKASAIGVSRDGELSQFNAGTVQRVGEESIGGAAFVLDGAPDDLSRIGAVGVSGSPQCSGKKSALDKFGGALGFGLLLPLLAVFGFRRRA